MVREYLLKLSKPTYTNFGSKQNLSPLLVENEQQTIEDWNNKRDNLRAQ